MYQKIFLVVLLSTINPLFAFVTVGPEGGTTNCTYTTIQQAIDSGDGEIRVVKNNNGYVENLNINHSVSIRGGFFNCLAASLNVVSESDLTVIDGSFLAGAPTININGLGSMQNVFEKLIIKNALDTQFVNGGHGIDLNSSIGSLTIKDSLIISNTAENGGGIYVANPTTSMLVTLERSSVFGNSVSESGGGIYCEGENAFISIRQQSFVGENMAQDGGGIAAIDGCTVTVDSGVDVFNSSDLRGIMDNVASNNGGGLYLNNATLYLQGNIYSILQNGNNTDPVTVAYNNAGNSGGGIYAENQSTVEIIDGLIDSNFSANSGGGLYLGLNSSLMMKTSEKPCWQKAKCSILSNNKTGETWFGGGVYSRANTVVNLFNTHVYGNRAQLGAVLYVVDTNGDIRPSVNLDGNYIYKNANNNDDGYLDNYLFRFFGFIDATIIHNTITANDINDSSTVFGINGGVDLHIANSIIDNQGESILNTEGSGFSVSTTCTLVNEDETITATPLGIFSVGYVDPNNDDYRLGPQSLAIDNCIGAGGIAVDSENQIRGWDDLSLSNINGAHDAGADESYLNDIIFSNGFE